MDLMRGHLKRFTSELVTITVGQGEAAKEFKVPKNLLTYSSNWFKKALEEDTFVEGKNNAISFPEDSPDAFEVLIFGMHRGQLIFAVAMPDSPDFAAHVELCFRVWILGDKILLPAFQNAIFARIWYLLELSMMSAEALLPAETVANCWRIASGHKILQRMLAEYIIEGLDMCQVDFGLEDVAQGCTGLLKAIVEAQRVSQMVPEADIPRFRKKGTLSS